MACDTCLKVEELDSKSWLRCLCPHVPPIVNLQEGPYKALGVVTKRDVIGI